MILVWLSWGKDALYSKVKKDKCWSEQSPKISIVPFFGATRYDNGWSRPTNAKQKSYWIEYLKRTLSFNFQVSMQYEFYRWVYLLLLVLTEN